MSHYACLFNFLNENVLEFKTTSTHHTAGALLIMDSN